MALHYRNDNPNGITGPNPDGERDKIAHITKHRGMKTPYTSVSEERNAIQHFEGETYQVEPNDLITDNHVFIWHTDLVNELQESVRVTKRADRLTAQRALILAQRAREALIDWQFNLSAIERKNRITYCYSNIQQYFKRA